MNREPEVITIEQVRYGDVCTFHHVECSGVGGFMAMMAVEDCPEYWVFVRPHVVCTQWGRGHYIGMERIEVRNDSKTQLCRWDNRNYVAKYEGGGE